MSTLRSVIRKVVRPVASSVVGSDGGGGGVTLLSSLVAYWSLADLTALTGGFTLTNTSAPNITFSSGKNGNAATWANGVSHHLYTADAANLRFGNSNWTIAMWVNFTRVGSTDYETILGKGDRFVGRELLLNRFRNRFDLQLYNGSTTRVLNLQFANAIPSTGWYFVCARHVAATKQVTLIINDKATASTYTTAAGTTTGVFSIGSDPSGTTATDAFTGGQIDEVAKWNRALSDEEILLLYNGGTGTFAPFTGEETPLTWTAERILFGNGIGDSLSSAKSTNTVGTHNSQGTLLSPARNIAAKWANSYVEYGPGLDTGENQPAYTNSLALRAAAHFNGRDATNLLTIDSPTLTVNNIASSAAAEIAGYKGELLNVRTEVTAGASDDWPAVSQSTSAAKWRVFGNTSAVSAAVSYAPGTDGQYHYGPAVVLGEIPANAATGRNSNTCVIRGDSISPYLQTICINESIPHLFLGRSGEAISDLLRSGADSTRTLLTRLAMVLVDQYGVNDIRAARTSSQLQADKAALWTAWVTGGASRIVTVTITPLPGFSTSERNSYNSWLTGLDNAAVSTLVGKSVEYVCIDVTAAVEDSPGSNTWIAGTSDDNVHPNATGVAAILAASQTAIADAVSDPL